MGTNITREQLDAIAGIYDAAIYPDKWQEVLDSVAEQAGAAGAGLFATDPTTQEFVLGATNSMFTPALLQEYAEKYHHTEAEAYRNLTRFPAQRLFTDSDILEGVADPETMPVRIWLRENFGTQYRAAARLHDKGVWFDVVVTQYHEQDERFAPKHLLPGDIFMPHLAKVVELSRTFMVLRHRFHAVLAALDRFHVGVMVLSPDLQVVVKNREMERILDQKDGLDLDPQGRPRADHSDVNDRMRQIARQIAATAQAEGNRPEGLLTISRRSGLDDYLVEVCPFCDPGSEFEYPFRGVFLMVVDPCHTDWISTRGMQQLYKLTSAEAAVCELLARGHATDEVAEIRGVTIETLRTQVKHVLQKTGTASRSQLVRLALMVNLPIDGDSSDQA